MGVFTPGRNFRRNLDLPMYFQKVLKGINGLSRADVAVMVKADGIRCDWRRDEVFIEPFSAPGLTICIPAFMTALQFATANFTTNGFIFHAWILTFGKPSVPPKPFAEEVRESRFYSQYLPYHREGEVIAKIVLPSTQIEKAGEYSGPLALKDLRTGKLPQPVHTIGNPNYAAPDKYSNSLEIV